MVKYIQTISVALFIFIFLLLIKSVSIAQESTENVPDTEKIKNTEPLKEKEKSKYYLGETVRLPVNIYDTYTFSKEVKPYMKLFAYASGPTFMLLYGVASWSWFEQDSFTLKPETYKGPYAINGAADKYGHAWANYMGKRVFTFLFRATGSSRNRANIEGALLMNLTSLITEVGDGFSPDYGFDPYDVLFNQIGILVAMLLDWSPFLDRIFTLKWEYFPSKKQRKRFDEIEQWDIATDYNDQKFLLTTKLGGIPYLSLSPLRYINLDLGYYTLGYRPAVDYPSRTRNLFVGISINYTIAFGDLLPVGTASSAIQSFFNYYHPPCDYEAKTWVLSDRPHSEFRY